MDLTPEEIQQVVEVNRRFNDFLNELVRDGLFYVYVIPDIIAPLYLRLRMYMPAQDSVRYVMETVGLTEARIQNNTINATLPDGEVVQYQTYEDVDGDTDVHNMLRQAAEGLSDDELNKFLEGLE